jgi:HK97 family phage portal protein
MGFWKELLFGVTEDRAEVTVETEIDNVLLSAFLESTDMDRRKALQIPTVASAITILGQVIASTPIKMYKSENGAVEEVKDDVRVKLLNDETGDTLNANDMWKAVVEDYFLGKGAYIYINKARGKVKSLHYIKENEISIIPNTDPIFKDFDIMVRGEGYKPYDFIKILRNSKDGASGTSIVTEHSNILSVAYNSLVFEENIVKKGGNKKGFLKSETGLSKEAMDQLKKAFKRLYSNNSENVVVLNKGIDFKEASNTLVEMQLNENKTTNAKEIGKIFHISPNLLEGGSASITPNKEIGRMVRLAAVPIMYDIQCALNKDYLLEKEKEFNVEDGKPFYYFAFDTKELLKGDIKERFEAYKMGIESNIMTIDEVRYEEDLPSLGLEFVKLGLADVLYNPKTKEIYTPNTGGTAKIDDLKGGETNENRD